MKYKIEIYQTENGNRPFSQWLKEIKNHKAKAKIRLRLDRLEMGNFGQCEPVGAGVYELKIDFRAWVSCLLWENRIQMCLITVRR